ncbi:MAG: glycosyltransferase [Lachnospiraceae bacterium]|nr:glycosyltransferase [Lachnospiraceae bacterium]
MAGKEIRMVSCIVTTYKRPIEILKRALDSVVTQTFQDIELIVVNDAPQEQVLAEEIRKLMETYNMPKQYIVHEKNQGACAARNTGIEQARGEYLAFLDDDDEWLPQKLARQMTYMQEEIALVYCSHYVIDRKRRKRLIEEPLAREGYHEDEFVQLLRVNFIGSTSYPLLRTEAVRAVGGFCTDIKASQDHDLWLRIAQKYKISYCREPLVILHYSEEAISRNIQNSIQGYEYLLKKYEDYYGKQRELLNYRLNYLAYCFLCVGEMKYVVMYWWRGIKAKLFSKHNFMLIAMVMKKLLAVGRQENRAVER